MGMLTTLSEPTTANDKLALVVTDDKQDNDTDTLPVPAEST